MGTLKKRVAKKLDMPMEQMQVRTRRAAHGKEARSVPKELRGSSRRTVARRLSCNARQSLALHSTALQHAGCRRGCMPGSLCATRSEGGGHHHSLRLLDRFFRLLQSQAKGSRAASPVPLAMADDLRFMQLFFNDRELKPTPHAVNGTVYDECSLDDLYMGAGTTLYGYDLSETPDYWPKRYNAAKETLEYLPEFEPPKKKEPVAQMMPEVEPLQGPSLYSRSRAIYTTELDSAQQRSQTGELDPGTDKPGNAERGILPGRWDEDRHPFLGSAAGQQFVTGKPNPTPLC